MPLVKAQCTNCNAMLEVDSSKDAAVCPHCGTPYIVEKAIQQFNIQNNYIQNANFSNGDTADALISAGDKFLNQGMYKDAWSYYFKAEKEYPSDYRGFWGELLKHTHNLTLPLSELSIHAGDPSDTKYECAESKIKYVRELYYKPYILAPEEKKGELKAKAETYISSLEKQKNELFEQLRIEESASEKSKEGGCYIATCIYGSYNCPEVWTLRRFRDDTLASTLVGRAFIKIYYAISPTMVKWFGNTKLFKKFWKGFLDKLVTHLNEKGVEDTRYYD